MLKSITVSFDGTSLKIFTNASFSDTNDKFKYPMQSESGAESEWPEGEIIDIWKEIDKMSIDQVLTLICDQFHRWNLDTVNTAFWVAENDLEIDNYKDLARGKDNSTEEEIVKSIQKRKKYAKLNDIQREYVSQFLRNNKIAISEASVLFKLSRQWIMHLGIISATALKVPINLIIFFSVLQSRNNISIILSQTISFEHPYKIFEIQQKIKGRKWVNNTLP